MLLEESQRPITILMRQQDKHRNIILFYNWINKLSAEENKVPKTAFDAKQKAGSATYNI